MDLRAIRTVLIAGGGIVGWSAAAALKRKLPNLSVSVIAATPAPNALADRMISTLPSIVDFHQDLGLTEADTVVRAGSGYRLGTCFKRASGTDYVHAYGNYGMPLGSAAFHQHWLRASEADKAAPFDQYSLAATIARRDRFASPHVAAEARLPAFGYGLHIDPGRYREMMRAFALHLGVGEIAGPIVDIALNSADGSIEHVRVAGGEVEADLYVDATGPQALLRSRLDDHWEDWSKWLEADRVLLAETRSLVEPSLLDRVVAAGGGWSWQVSASACTSHGLVYSSKDLLETDAENILRSTIGEVPIERIEIRQGRWAEPWVRNCVAIGDSAVAVEPLEWTNLHLAHGAIDRLAAMMPDRDFSPVELWDYNRQVSAEADRVRDFLLLHYPAGCSSDEAALESLPTSFAHTIRQFRERGRLPFYEEETFSRDSWAAVLIGQSVIPRRIDPLTDATAPSESHRAMEQLREAIGSFVARLPKYSDHLQRLGQKAA